ncbi:hypothetical protein [Bradyrhizobium canariense]|uniref:hypothetical protein n=1 Tax=Bradyrhizobium canariense TaxID=255045 RepID=UPI00142F8B83|nr:hypothetical protein [Bradyrhizobium canariense]
MPEPTIDPTTSATSAPRESFWSDEFEDVMLWNEAVVQGSIKSRPDFADVRAKEIEKFWVAAGVISIGIRLENPERLPVDLSMSLTYWGESDSHGLDRWPTKRSALQITDPHRRSPAPRFDFSSPVPVRCGRAEQLTL